MIEKTPGAKVQVKNTSETSPETSRHRIQNEAKPASQKKLWIPPQISALELIEITHDSDDFGTDGFEFGS